MIRHGFGFLAASLFLTALSAQAYAAITSGNEVHIAGLTPHQRPAKAPAIREFKPTPEWRQNALRGISDPVPASLKFLNDQGAWYTPFDHPGMPGYYDLRQMHAKPVRPTP